MPGSYSRRAGTDRTLGSSRGFDLALLGGGTQQELCVYVRLVLHAEGPSVHETGEDVLGEGRGSPGRGGRAISMLARGVSGTSLSATDTSVVHANFWPCGFDSAHVSSGGVNPQGRGGGGPPLRKDQGPEGVIGKMMAAIEEIQGLATSWRVWSPMDRTSTLWTSPPHR